MTGQSISPDDVIADTDALLAERAALLEMAL